MEKNDLISLVVNIKGVELKEKTRKDGTTWKDYDVKIEDQEKGVFYTLPIKKADGTFTKAYDFYKQNKAEWDDAFVNDAVVPVRIAVSEKQSKWEKNGKSGTSVYRTIRFMETVDILHEA